MLFGYEFFAPFHDPFLDIDANGSSSRIVGGRHSGGRLVSVRWREAYWSAVIMRASWVTIGVGFHGLGLSRMRSLASSAVRGMGRCGVTGDR